MVVSWEPGWAHVASTAGLAQVGHGALDSARSASVEPGLQADCVPAFKGTEFPTEAGAKRVVDAVGLVADFWHAVTHVGKDVRENAAVEFACLVLAVEQELGALAKVVDVFGGGEGGELDLLFGLVIERLEVQGVDLFLAVGDHLLVEALARLAAQPALIDEVLDV